MSDPKPVTTNRLVQLLICFETIVIVFLITGSYYDNRFRINEILATLHTENGPYAFVTLDEYCAATYTDGSLLGTVTTDTGAKQVFCVAPYAGVEIVSVLRSGKIVEVKPTMVRRKRLADKVVAINKTKFHPLMDNIDVPAHTTDACDHGLGRLVAVDNIWIADHVDLQVTYASVFCLDDAGLLVLLDDRDKEIGRWSNFVLAPRRE